MKRPLLWGFVILGLGIVFAYFRVSLWVILLFSCLLFGMPVLVKKIKKTQMLFVFGLFYVGIVLGYGSFPTIDALEPFYEKQVMVTGVVTDYPIIKDDRLVINLNTKEIVASEDNSSSKNPIGLKATLYLEADKKTNESADEKSSMDQVGLKPGDVLTLSGVLSEPAGKRNPGGFDYDLYLKSQSINGLLAVKPESIETIGEETSLYYKILGMKRHLENQCDVYFPEDVSDLLKGVIFGEKDISEELTQDFQNAGVTHVLSVSGLHVAYVFLVLSFILMKIKIKKKYWLLFLLPALVFYTALTGFSPPVIRASIMLACLTLGQGLHRERDPLNQLCLAGIIILGLWPSQLFQAGFQLSMGAVLGILLFYGPLLFLYKKYRNKKFSRYKRNPGPIAEGLVLTFCATIGTLPILLYHFKTFTYMSFFSNLLVVPLIGVFLLTGMLFLLCITLFPFMGPLLSVPITFLGESILVVLTGINDMSNIMNVLWINRGGFTIPEIGLFLLITFLGSGYFYLKATMVKNTVMVMGCGFVLVLMLSSYYPKNLVVTILDVGQGDSILIETPGGLNYLVDGGGYLFPKASKISESVLYPALYSKNIRELDGLFLTHNHVDHSQGIEELMVDGYPVKNLFMSIQTNNDNLLNQTTVPVSLLKKGSIIEGSDGVKLEVYSPTGAILPKSDDEQNNGSLVMKLSYKNTNLLLCGDIEEETEQQILADVKEDAQENDYQIIKIPHHGSKTSSTQEFIRAVDPEMAVISVGAHNYFGHPNDEVLNRLKKENIETLRTDESGAVEISSNGDWIHYKNYAN